MKKGNLNLYFCGRIYTLKKEFDFLIVSVTEEEFLTLAENLRPWTARAMKIEVAPWIRDYVTEMQELYCDLILEKIAYKPYGKEMTIIDNYTVLFDEQAQVPNKILAKGDPGMGKTTLAKKIAWDWAKGHFSKISIVLFLYLKSVHPSDSLEKVMLQQIPELEGLGITPKKLESFLEHFGRKCLLICDGLDEHSMGSNKDVLKVTRHEKYLYCNVFVTSRPHNTIEIQSNFDTIVSVEGFTRSEARKYAYCIVRDEKVVEQILDFNPTGDKQEVSLCKCPILLSFICILVREKALDLSTTTLPTGEMYARMVQCLYKKFTLRREIDFDEIEFTRVVTLVGKLAWETLSSNEPLFKRSRVEAEVGIDAFDYGFLIGHEDLINDLKADILITFPHRSIQEFFAAFFFVLQLTNDRAIEFLAEAFKFMTNPVFLHFCFWFLREKCTERYFTFGNRNKALEILHSYIYGAIHRELGSREITKTFPAIHFQRALQTKDHINIEHFERILKRFERIKYIVVIPDYSVEWILNHILPTCQTLMVVDESEEPLHCVLPKFLQFDGNNINILLSEQAYRVGILRSLLQKAVQWDRQPHVYLFLTEGKTVDLSEILSQKMHQLHMVGIGPVRTKVIAAPGLASATFLTHLSITGRITVRKNVIVAINKAIGEGQLPRLQSLCFTGSSGMTDLFRRETTLLNITHLDFSTCKIYDNYLQALNVASKNGLLPKLTSLAISDDKYSVKPGGKNYFDCSWVNLTSLSVKDMTERGFGQLSQAISKSRLKHLMKLCLSLMQNAKCDLREIDPEKIPLLEHLSVQRCIASREDLEQLSRLVTCWSLQTLDISHSRDITGNLSVLLSQGLTSLENLILHDCQLNEQDLVSLGRANAEGRLSELENLDLSDNHHLIESFGAISSQWSSLKKLRIDYATPNQSSISKRWFNMLRPLLDSGCIPSIEELRITTTNSFPERTGHWEHLKRLNIVVLPLLTDQKINHMFDCLVTSVQMGDLPSLRTVCLLTDNKIGGRLSNFKSYFSTLKRKSVDVCVVDQDLETIMVNAGLA